MPNTFFGKFSEPDPIFQWMELLWQMHPDRALLLPSSENGRRSTCQVLDLLPEVEVLAGEARDLVLQARLRVVRGTLVYRRVYHLKQQRKISSQNHL